MPQLLTGVARPLLRLFSHRLRLVGGRGWVFGGNEPGLLSHTHHLPHETASLPRHSRPMVRVTDLPRNSSILSAYRGFTSTTPQWARHSTNEGAVFRECIGLCPGRMAAERVERAYFCVGVFF